MSRDPANEALIWADRGHRVAPLRWKSKKPATRWLNGPERATADVTQVREWFAAGTYSGYLIACGRGLVVLDVDIYRDGAPKDLDEVAALFGEEVLSTFRVGTPRGGMHLYFEADHGHNLASTHSAWFRGVDFQADGSYVVGPGSATADGRYLVEHDLAIRRLPTLLSDLGCLRLLASQRESAFSSIKEQTGRRTALNRASYTIGGLVGAGRLTLDQAEAWLNDVLEAAVDSGCGAADVRSILASGMGSGIQKPLYRQESVERRTHREAVQAYMVHVATIPRKGKTGPTDRAVELAHLIISHRAGGETYTLSSRQAQEVAGLSSADAVSSAQDRLMDIGVLSCVKQPKKGSGKGSRQNFADPTWWRHSVPNLHIPPLGVQGAPVCTALARLIFLLNHDLFRRTGLGPVAHHILCALLQHGEPMALEDLAEAIGQRQPAALTRSSGGKRGALMRLAEADLVFEDSAGQFCVAPDVLADANAALDEALERWDECSAVPISGKGQRQRVQHRAERSAYLGFETTTENGTAKAQSDFDRWVSPLIGPPARGDEPSVSSTARLFGLESLPISEPQSVEPPRRKRSYEADGRRQPTMSMFPRRCSQCGKRHDRKHAVYCGNACRGIAFRTRTVA